MKYVLFDNTGTITQWGEAPSVPPGGLAHTIEGSLADFYVDIAMHCVRPKQRMTLTVPEDCWCDTECVVGGLPEGTVVDFVASDAPYHLRVDDGTLELTIHDPQTIVFRFWHSHYRHPDLELTFHEVPAAFAR